MDEDLDLINRTRAGEREAFDDLVLKYQKPLYSLLYRMLSSPDDSADVLQKTGPFVIKLRNNYGLLFRAKAQRKDNSSLRNAAGSK